MDTELRLATCPKTSTRDVSFEEIEAELFEMKVKQNRHPNADLSNLNYIPFRLTPNIEGFIGPIGLQGLFAGVVTAASLAISAQAQNYGALL